MQIAVRSAVHVIRKRATLVYVLAVAAPALALSILGLLSIQRERRALEAQADSNDWQATEQIVDAVERRVSASAESCLKDVRIDFPEVGTDSPSPAFRRSVRRHLDGVRRHHPVAAALFVWRGDHLLLPQSLQGPRRLDDLLAGEPPLVAARFASLFESAEDLELQAERPREAGVVYRRAFDLPVSAELRALALSRVARCAEKATDHAGAVRAYRRILTQFPDDYDLANQPYGVIAALELDDLGAGGAREALERVARDVSDGRWELTANAAEYLLTAVSRHLGPQRARRSGPYLAYLSLAEPLQRYAPPAVRLGIGAVVPPVAASMGTDQLFYLRTAAASPTAADVAIGLVVDLRWVETELLPATLHEQHVSQTTRVVPMRGNEPPQAIRAATLRVPFRRLFPFWALETRRSRPGARASNLLFAASAGALVAVLVLGAVLLIRDASREAALGRVRSDLVSGISHDLKTPLTLIRMYGELLSEDPGALEHERSGYYRIITRESERLTRLIDRVLQFSRIERGSTRYRLERLDLGDVVRRIRDDYERFLRQQEFVLQSHLSSVPPVDADADAVREAIGNLLDNAAKYSGESRSVGLHLFERSGEVVVEVRDQGVGIDPGVRSRLFEPYVRGRHTGKGGYGLGLYLVRQVMDGHHGRIEVDSRPDEGSTFRLVFPAAPVTAVVLAP